MYDCYNEAVRWYNKQRKIRETARHGYIYVDSHDAKVVNLLLNQYHYGISAKKDLYYKMIELGVINENNLLEPK